MERVTSAECEPGRGQVDRRRTSAQVLDEVRRTPGITRVELARRLGLSSGSTTETVARLREVGWLDERRAPVTGRGRPTTCLVPRPDGPQVLALDLRHEEWRLAVAGLDGVPTVLARGRRPDDPQALLAHLAAAVAEHAGYAGYAPDPAGTHTPDPQHPAPRGSRPRPLALGLAVPAPLADDRFVPATGLDWSGLVRGGPDGSGPLVAALGAPEVPVLPGNDATLAGLAEARTGAAVGARTAVSLTVEVGLGGTLLLDGRPQTGAHGAAGEFGHLPMGDPAVPCPCGASGCWGPELDGRALARHLGVAPPADPRTFAAAVLDRADSGDDAAAAAVSRVAAALGRGVAGLVNAHDPDVVVLGGLGPRLRAPGAGGRAFDEAYGRGLMAYRRAAPTVVRDGVHGDDAPLHGALALALDHATTAEALARAAAGTPAVPTRAAPDAPTA